MTASLVYLPLLQFLDATGVALPGAKLYSYLAGGSTPATLYADAAMATPLSNPAVADSQGKLLAYMPLGTAYKLDLFDQFDVHQAGWPVDGVSQGSTTLDLAGYSATVTQMRLKTDPGEVGSESLATTMAGELERLRFSAYETKRAMDPSIAQWYETPYGLPMYNVQAYGAVGDGMTDDAAAIQAALTAVPAGGGIVYVPAGTYLVGTGLNGGSHTILRGAGMGTSIVKMKNSANLAYVLRFASKTAIVVEDVTVDANYANNTSGRVDALILTGCTDFVVQRTECTGAAGNGAGSVGVGLTAGGSSQRFVLRENSIHDCGTVGLRTSDGIFASGRDFAIVNNLITACTDTAVAYNPTSTNSNDPDGHIVIAHNRSVDTPQGVGYGAVAGRYCDGLVCQGNTVSGHNASNGAGIVFINAVGSQLSSVLCVGNTVRDGVRGKGILFQRVDHLTCVGNSSVRNDQTHDEAGLYFLDCQQLTCSGNLVTDNGGPGIIVAGTQYFTLTGNTCLSNGVFGSGTSAGIKILQSSLTATESLYGALAGNTLSGSPQKYGLLLSNASDFLSIGAYTAEGNDTAEVSNTATGTSIRFSARRTGSTFTVTGTGFTANPTATARYEVIDDLVSVYLPVLSATSNADAFQLTGMPAALMPSRTRWQAVRVTDNGTDAFGLLLVTASSTTLTLYPAAASAGGSSLWTASGTKTLHAALVQWTIGTF